MVMRDLAWASFPNFACASFFARWRAPSLHSNIARVARCRQPRGAAAAQVLRLKTLFSSLMVPRLLLFGLHVPAAGRLEAAPTRPKLPVSSFCARSGRRSPRYKGPCGRTGEVVSRAGNLAFGTAETLAQPSNLGRRPPLSSLLCCQSFSFTRQRTCCGHR